MWMQVNLVLCTASQTLPPPGSMCSPSPVQTPLSAHSALLLHLPMLIVPLYFIAVIAVQEKKRRKQDLSLREMVVPPNQVKFSIARWCPIPVRDLHIEDKLCGDIGLSFPKLMGRPLSFNCLVKFHSKSYLVLDYQQYMMH